MFINQAIMIMFKILNFSVIIGFFVFLFYRYGLANIRKKIKEKKEAKYNLLHRKKNLFDQLHQVEREIEAQRLYGEELQIKVEDWTFICEENRKKSEAERMRLHQKMHELVQKQAKQQAYIRMKKEVIPEAITQATRELKVAFKDKRKNMDYVDSVINYMKNI